CGWSRLTEKIVIVDTNTSISCAQGQVGEIWITGPNVALGYWKNPEATRATFEAKIETDETHYLRTGDLGFLLDNELYVTGRLKNMMVVAGRNIHLEDVEHTIIHGNTTSGISDCAAFCIDSNLDQQLVLLVGIERAALRNIRQNKIADEAMSDEDELRQSLGTMVIQQHDVSVHDIVFVRTGDIPKTSSGKTQHYKCREQYLANKLANVTFN
ncbi:MAG: hypothetical protein ACR2PH_16330, partial [Desulfobulbia bacterium]